jgi:hypothetical protein
MPINHVFISVVIVNDLERYQQKGDRADREGPPKLSAAQKKAISALDGIPRGLKVSKKLYASNEMLSFYLVLLL